MLYPVSFERACKITKKNRFVQIKSRNSIEKHIARFTVGYMQYNKILLCIILVFCCGGWDRTIGLQVMSLTSYHCSTPRHLFPFAPRAISEIVCKGTAFF